MTNGIKNIGGYDEKNNKEHDICHREIGIIVKKKK